MHICSFSERKRGFISDMEFAAGIAIILIVYILFFRILSFAIDKWGIDFLGLFEDLWIKIKKINKH